MKINNVLLNHLGKHLMKFFDVSEPIHCQSQLPEKEKQCTISNHVDQGIFLTFFG